MCSKVARGSPCHSVKVETHQIIQDLYRFLEKSRSYFVFFKKQFSPPPSTFQFKVERHSLYSDSRCQEGEPTVGLLLPNGTQFISPSVHLSWTFFFFLILELDTDTFKGALLSKLSFSKGGGKSGRMGTYNVNRHCSEIPQHIVLSIMFLKSCTLVGDETSQYSKQLVSGGPVRGIAWHQHPKL